MKGVLSILYVPIIVRDSKFINNTAVVGGAIYSISTFANITNTVFKENHVSESGGAIYSKSVVSCVSSHFESNSARESGGALYIDAGRQSRFDVRTAIANTSFLSNQAGLSGGAVFIDGYKITFLVFSGGFSMSNSAKYGGFAYFHLSTIGLLSEYNIISNTAFSGGGAIFAVESLVFLYDTTCHIKRNLAHNNGGGFYFINSNIVLLAQSTIIFSHNMVTSIAGKGGAIFVLNKNCAENYGPRRECLVSSLNGNETALIFINNSASVSSVLYGGLLDRCIPAHSGKPLGLEMIEFKEMSQYDSTPLAISSEPLTLCLCSDGNINCTLRELTATKMRRGVLSIGITALDQNKNSVPAITKANYKELSAQIVKGEERKKIPDRCKELQYHIHSTSSEATLVLGPEGPCTDSPLSIITVHITLVPCSVGFEQDKDRCICDRRLTDYISLCDIATHSVHRKGLVWLRYDEEYLKIYSTCPLNYCETSEDNISISHPNKQCANHRSGILCGACQQNYSIALGGSKCLQCVSSYSFVLLTLACAVAGVALVALLLVCNMTVFAGTLNGLIFYANVVSISGLTSLRHCSIHPILSVFIAWVNLDLGVETCFYSGLDTYYKTWLQFVFPLYIWLLVGAVLVTSYYSSTAMKIFGRNNIAILATLFLLSYTKLVKTVITTLTFTQVLVGRAHNVTDQLLPYKVWTYDGNIDYLIGKHIPLFVVALIFLLALFLPYTMVLIFGQCLRSMSVRRGLRWIHSTAFLSVLDPYHAPYNKKHRYWTGLMLLTRCLLFLIFATNYKDNTLLTNMYSVTLVITGILTIKTFSTKIYKNIYISALELSFLLNLEVLAATLHYLESKGSSDKALCDSITASISICFIIFFGILAYHAHLQIKKTSFYAPIHSFYSRWQNRMPHILQKITDNHSEEVLMLSDTNMPQLRETLLDSGEKKT